MNLGFVGLGKMGAAMLERARRAGVDAVGYDADPARTEVASLADLKKELKAPRTVWLMLPAGDITEATISELAGILDRGDLIVDGGNANYRDSIRRADWLYDRTLGFVDCGVSGGVWGLNDGYCLMVGAEPEHYEQLAPVLEALAVDGGLVHAGGVGAGHFTKMVHNGVEYAMMQALGEGYELLTASELDIDADATLAAWRQGSVVRSWLLDLLVEALAADPGLVGVPGRAADSGEGRWTVQEAVELGVPAPAITAALFARFASRQDDAPSMKVISALRRAFGGHALDA